MIFKGSFKKLHIFKNTPKRQIINCQIVKIFSLIKNLSEKLKPWKKIKINQNIKLNKKIAKEWWRQWLVPNTHAKAWSFISPRGQYLAPHTSQSLTWRVKSFSNWTHCKYLNRQNHWPTGVTLHPPVGD